MRRPRPRPRKPGRPRLEPILLRSRRLAIGLNQHERDLLRERARAAGLPLRTFARRALLRGRVHAPRIPPVNLAAILELRRLGVLLNQLTKRVHQGRLAPELRPTLVELARWLERLQADLIGLPPDDRASG